MVFKGVSSGLENNIALIPVAAILSLALGGDLILAGISVGMTSALDYPQ